MNDENNNQTDGDNDGTDGKKYPLNIDVDLRYSTELTWNHKALVQLIRVLVKGGREVFATDGKLAGELGLSTSAVSKALPRLLADGWITKAGSFKQKHKGGLRKKHRILIPTPASECPNRQSTPKKRVPKSTVTTAQNDRAY